MPDPDPKPDPNEAELIEALALHAGWLRSYLGARLPARFRGVVSEEDLLQDVWVRFFRNAGSLQERGDQTLQSYLMRAADHALIDTIRTHKTAKRGGRTPGGRLYQWRTTIAEALSRRIQPERTPSGASASREQAEAVRNALAQLSVEQREALRLRYFEGQTIQEIAQSMQKSKTAANSLLYAARKRLRQHLGRASRFFTHVRDVEDTAEEQRE